MFNEPWEAQAFAMVVRLHEAGVFTWSQWAEALSAQIHGGRQRSYYQHWLDALETLLAQGDLVSRDVLERRQLAWRAAAARTPHGEPIEL